MLRCSRRQLSLCRRAGAPSIRGHRPGAWRRRGRRPRGCQRVGQVDGVPGGRRAGAAHHPGHPDRALLLDGEDVTGVADARPGGASSASASRTPSTQLSGVCGDACSRRSRSAPMNLGVPRDEVHRRGPGLRWTRWASRRLAARDPARLSGGQMQLVAIAGLLAMRPRHLVLDEPTAQLDPAGTRARRGGASRDWPRDGASILIAEQKTDLLARVCSRVVVLDAGRIVLDGPAADVLADPRLEELGVPRPVGRPAAAGARRRRAADRACRADARRMTEHRARGPGPRLSRRRRPGARRRRPGHRGRRAGRARRPERQRQVHAGPPPQRPAATDRRARALDGPMPRPHGCGARAPRGPVLPGPGPPDLRGQRSAPRSPSGPATWACRGDGAASGRRRGARGRRASTASRAPTRTTWATPGASC